MPSSSILLNRSRLFSWTAIPLALALIVAGAVFFVLSGRPAAQAAPAAKPPVATKTARPGVGYKIRGQWFGTWKAVGGTGFCIDFDRDHPNSNGSKSLSGKVPGMNTEESAQAKYVANKYGLTKSRLDGAASAIVIWKIQHTSRFDKFYASLLKKKAVSSKIQKRAKKIAAEAKLHGPYRVKVSMGSGLVGQSFTGTATVTTSKGKAVPNVPVRLTVNANGRLTKKATKSDRRGRVAFTNQVIQTGTVRVDANLAMASAAGALITKPTGNHQRLLVASKRTQTAKAFATSVRALGAPSMRSGCSGDCHGAAPVTVTMKNAAGSARLREYIYSNAKLVASFDIPAGKSVSKSINLPDAAKVTTRYCYLTSTGRCTNAVTANAGTLTVVCPAWIDYTYSGTCPCNPGKNLSYAVSVPANTTRRYLVTLSETRASGVKVAPQTVELVKGQRYTFKPLRFAKGDRVKLSFSVLGKTHVLDDMTQMS